MSTASMVMGKHSPNKAILCHPGNKPAKEEDRPNMSRSVQRQQLAVVCEEAGDECGSEGPRYFKLNHTESGERR